MTRVRQVFGAFAILAGAALIWVACLGLHPFFDIAWADLEGLAEGDVAGGGVVHVGLLNVMLPGLAGVGLVVAGTLGLSRRRPVDERSPAPS